MRWRSAQPVERRSRDRRVGASARLAGRRACEPGTAPARHSPRPGARSPTVRATDRNGDRVAEITATLPADAGRDVFTAEALKGLEGQRPVRMGHPDRTWMISER
jgi:hypothetical protein